MRELNQRGYGFFTIFIIASVVYHWAGLIIKNPLVDVDTITPLYLAYFSALFVGALFASRIRVRIKKMRPFGSVGAVRFRCLILISIAIIAYIVVILLNGVPILNIGQRSGVSGYLTYLVSSLWFLLPYVYLSVKKRWVKIYMLLSVIVFVSMGYRTPNVMLGLVFLALNLKYRKFDLRKRHYICAVLLLFLVVAIYPLIRVDDIDLFYSALEKIGVPSFLAPVAPALFVFSEGAEVLTGIIEVIDATNPHFGSFTISGMLTFLPGFTLHSRLLLTQMLGRNSAENNVTTTSTLLGQIYIEGGIILVILMGLVLGYALIRMGKNIRYANQSSTALYCVLYCGLLVSIHTGFLDPIYILYFVYHVFITSNHRPQRRVL